MQEWCLLPLTPPHLYSSREPTSIPDLTDVSRRVPDPPVTTSRPRFSKIVGGVTSRLCSSSTPPLILFKTVPLRQQRGGDGSLFSFTVRTLFDYLAANERTEMEKKCEESVPAEQISSLGDAPRSATIAETTDSCTGWGWRREYRQVGALPDPRSPLWKPQEKSSHLYLFIHFFSSFI